METSGLIDEALVARLVKLFCDLVGAPDLAAALPDFEDGLAEALEMRASTTFERQPNP